MNALARKQRLIAQDRSVEWLCAWLMLAWAVTLAMPGDTFSYPSLSGFRHHGLTESSWTLFFVVLGAGRMVALYINGRWPKSAIVRQVCAFAGFFSWAQIAVMLYQNGPGRGAPWVPNILISAVLAVAELHSLLRARFDERYYHR